MSVAEISTYIGQFFSGGVDESTPHLILILLVVGGGIAVGGGIIWEAARSGHLWTLPTAAVFLGVVIEAAATVILFEFDEGISRHQQSTIGAQQSVIRGQNDKIIGLERRLAPRVISDDQKSALVTELRPFASIEFDAATNVHDNEQSRLLVRIMEVLTEAGWKQIDWKYDVGGITYKFGAGSGSPNIGETSTYDVEIQVRKESLERLKPAAEALVGALRAIDIAAHAVAADRTTVNNANLQALHLIVGQRL